MADLQWTDFIAVRRLSDADNNTLAEVGQTCERVPAAKSGGTVEEALLRLEASGHIRRVEQSAPGAAPTPEPMPEPAEPSPAPAAPVHDAAEGEEA